MKKNLIIIGAGGHGRVAADIAVVTNEWDQIRFLDDDETITRSMGIMVMGKASDWRKYINDYSFFVAVGNNVTRKELQDKLAYAGADIPALVHPSAVTGHGVMIGPGTVIMAGVIVNCGSIIGKGCIINTGALIDHDNEIGDYVHVSPGASLAGTVKVGNKTWMGIGSMAVNNVSITDDCIIGAGAVVIEDITEPGTYVGVPARRIR